MKPTARPLALLAGALFLAPTLPTAQTEGSHPVQALTDLHLEAVAPDSPVIHATYHVPSGRVTYRSDEAGLTYPAASLLRGGGPVETVCFDSEATLNWSVFDAFDEIVDWGTKSCGRTGWVSRITISYGTREVDPAFGGPGGTLGLAIYAGTEGFGILGTELARYDLTGLPGTIALPGSPPSTAVVLTLDLGDEPIFLPDGPIGWGYSRIDDTTGPFILSGGAPFEQGVIDALDVYRPGPATDGNFEGTFNFGAFCACGSFYLVLSEYFGLPRTSWTTVPSSVPPTGGFLSAGVGAPFGRELTLSISPSTPAGSLVALSAAPFGPGTLTPYGEVLVDFGQLLRPLHFSTSAGHTFPVPTDPLLVGFRLYAQGITLASPPRLSSAVSVLVGF